MKRFLFIILIALSASLAFSEGILFQSKSSGIAIGIELNDSSHTISVIYKDKNGKVTKDEAFTYPDYETYSKPANLIRTTHKWCGDKFEVISPILDALGKDIKKSAGNALAKGKELLSNYVSKPQ